MTETIGGRIVPTITPGTEGPSAGGPTVSNLSSNFSVTRTGEVSIPEIYPFAKEVNPQLVNALALLAEGLGFVSEARGYLLEGNPVAADDCAMRLRALLPELFCFDQMSDGFRGIVLATLHSLTNLDGQMVSQEQLVRIKEALELIMAQPFLAFDQVLDVHELFESAGLIPDPKDADEMNEVMDEIANPTSDSNLGDAAV